MPGETGNLLVSCDDGVLRCYAPDTTQLWQLKVGGEARAVADPRTGRIAVGTPRGELLWLDPQGQVQNRVDLMPHNLVQDRQAYVAAYTARPDVPMRQPLPNQPPTIEQRAGETVKFSANLLPAQDASTASVGSEAIRLGTPRLEKGQTYVLSVTGQVEGLAADAEAGMFLVTFADKSGKFEQRFELPLSAGWAERTLAFRPPADATYQVSLQYALATDAQEGETEKLPGTSVQLRGAKLMHMEFRSENVLAQRVPDAPGGELTVADPDRPSRNLGGLLGIGAKVTPPSIRFVLPNDVDLTARSRGAPPFKQVLDFTTPFDGRITGQETSWLKKPANGSTHARLELEFKEPLTLSSLAVYEDPTAANRYTGTFGIFLHDPETDRWSQAGVVVGNQSPFNLFTFEPTNVDQIAYVWLKSPDGHVRVAELEGYRSESLLLP